MRCTMSKNGEGDVEGYRPELHVEGELHASMWGGQVAIA